MKYICCSEGRSLESWGSRRSCAQKQRFGSTPKPYGLFIGPCVKFTFHSVAFLFSLCYKNGGQEFWGALSGLFSIDCGCRMFQSRCRTSVLLCSNALQWNVEWATGRRKYVNFDSRTPVARSRWEMALLYAYISWSPLLFNKFPIRCIKVEIKQQMYHPQLKENVFMRPIQTERRVFKEAEVTFYTACWLP